MIKRLIFIYLSILLLLTGCTNYHEVSEDNNNYPIIDPTPSDEYAKLILYFPKHDLTKLDQEVRVVSTKNKPLEEIVINEVLKGPSSSEMISLLPEDAKLLSIDVIEGIAFVSFSHNLVSRNYSAREEILALYSVVNSLTQLENIVSVQVLIDGESRDVFHKNLSLANPKEFSSIIVKEGYQNPIDTLDDFYDSILTADYTRTMNLFSNDKKGSFKKGILTSYFQELFRNVDEVVNIDKIIIGDYMIEQYGVGSSGRTSLWVKAVSYFGNSGKTTIIQNYELVFSEGRFKILEVGDVNKDINVFNR